MSIILNLIIELLKIDTNSYAFLSGAFIVNHNNGISPFNGPSTGSITQPATVLLLVVGTVCKLSLEAASLQHHCLCWRQWNSPNHSQRCPPPSASCSMWIRTLPLYQSYGVPACAMLFLQRRVQPVNTLRVRESMTQRTWVIQVMAL